MFLIPFVAIPVGTRLFQFDQGTGRSKATIAVVALVAVQTFVTEILLTTYW
jgi:hypothetical protein